MPREDPITVDAHADVDMRGMRGHATTFCSRRPIRTVDHPNPTPKIPMIPRQMQASRAPPSASPGPARAEIPIRGNAAQFGPGARSLGLLLPVYNSGYGPFWHRRAPD